ncbi:hypothetical protein [Zavarzinella formosa]|uniref:hypothetical protein n=1 Tax=Zavarzinella formosa TaxID=360055 RepID=UPI0002D94BD1|nr:hypothetical protein [Zavarzinella formosa]
MKTGIALSQSTYDRLMRMLSAFEGGRMGNGGDGVFPQEPELVLLAVASSTIGTYGYPAKYQIFDESTGAWANDDGRPETVYLNDVAATPLKSGEQYFARFSGFRGDALESVYTVVHPLPLIPDTAHDVKGKINLLGQHLGNGSKGVDSLWVGIYDRSDGALFANSSGAIWVTGKTAGVPNSGELQTGAFTSILSGVGANAQAKAYTDGSRYGWNFLTNGGTGGGYQSIFTAVYGASGNSLISTDNISLAQNCHARTYSVKYGILTFAGDSSIGFDPASGVNQTRGLNFVHGIYIGGDMVISYVDIAGGNTITFGSTTR